MNINKTLLASFIMSLSLIQACGSPTGMNPEEALVSAREEMSEGKITSSIIILKNVLQQKPDNKDARVLLGEAYMLLGSGDAAEKEFERAIRLGDTSDETNLKLLKSKHITGKNNEILKETDALVSDDPSAEILALRGSAYISLNRHEKAKESLVTAITKDARSYEALLGLAKMSMHFKDYDEARKRLNRAIEINARDYQAWSLTGLLELFDGNFEESEKAYKKSLDLANNNPNILIGLIRSLISQLKLAEAKKNLALVGRLIPKNQTLLYLNAYVAALEKDHKKAKALLQELVSKTSKNAHALLLLARINYVDGQYEQVKDSLSHYIKMVPDSIPASILLASTLMSLNENQDAIDLLLPLVDKDNTNTKLMMLLGSAYLRADQLDKGIEILKKAQQINPEAAYITTQLAVGLMADGSTDEAIKTLERGLQLDSGLFHIDYMLILTKLSQKKYSEALEDTKKFLLKGANNPVAHNLMGNAYIGLKNFELAKKSFEKALAIEPRFTTAINNLAYLEIQNKNFDAAKQHYLQALKINDLDPDAIIGIRAIYWEQNLQDELLQLLLKTRKKHPDNAGTRVMLAEYYLEAGDYRMAAEESAQALQRSPNNTDVMMLRIKALRMAGNIDTALNELKDLDKISKDSVRLLIKIASLELQLQDYSAAKTTLNRLITSSPDNVDALIALGKVETLSGNHDEGIKIAKKIQYLQPDKPEGYSLEGNFHMFQSNTSKAIIAYKKALQVGQKHQHAIDLYRAQFMSGNKNAAKGTLEEWLSKHPDHILVRMALARYYEGENIVERAIQEYEKILELKADYLVAINNLALLYLSVGDARATSLAQKLLKNIPQTELTFAQASMLDTVGWVFVNQQQFAKGDELIKKALGSAPDLPELQYHAAASLAMSGDKNNALNLLNKTLEKYPEFSGRNEAVELLNKLKSE